MSRTRTTALAAAAALTAAAFAPAVTVGTAVSDPATDAVTGQAPEAVPDRGAVLSEPIARGELQLSEAAARTPSAKTVDGDAGDWIGEATRVSGTSRYDAGELVHTDFLFDAHGADDGGDRQRLEDFAGLFYAETRAQRIDQLLRTSGSQLGVPEPIGAPDEYGDADGGLDVADLTELRLASDGEDLQLLAGVANLTDPSRLGVLVLADTDAGDNPNQADVLGSGLSFGRYENAALLTDGHVATHPVVLTAAPTGSEPEPFATSVVDADGWENHLEASLPLSFVAGDDDTVDVAVVAGRVEDDGSFTPLNVAFRGDEPVEIFNDRAQAFALLDGNVDAFSSGPVAVSDLSGGRTQDWAFGPGYYERHITSGTNISRESGDDGVHQPYGLYVPTAFDPADADQRLPMTYWLHYRGGKAHSGTVINPRLTTQLGEERGNLVVFPHGRGTSEWYVTESHQDVFEVMADAEVLFAIDETRRYVSGYSMGGYGTWLFTSLYPDMFAAGFAQSGAITQGAWLGTGGEGDPVDPLFDQGWQEANSGDARAQLTYRAIENLRHVPIAIDHGTNDELAINPQVERAAEKLTRLGYEHRFTRFLGYEHFTQAIMDEWADGAAYLDRFAIDPNPREVTYAVVPALVHAVNTVDPANGATFDYDPDGAYWIDDIEVREVGERTTVDDGEPGPALDAKGTVHATAGPIPAPGGTMVPDAGAVSPVDHSTPFVRTGLQFVEDPTGLTAPATSNSLELDLTNVASVSADVPRTRLDTLVRDGATVTLSFTTDGTTTVRLADALVDGGLLGLLAHGPTADDEQVFSIDGDDVLVRLPDAGNYAFGVTVLELGGDTPRVRLTTTHDGRTRTAVR